VDAAAAFGFDDGGDVGRALPLDDEFVLVGDGVGLPEVGVPLLVLGVPSLNDAPASASRARASSTSHSTTGIDSTSPRAPYMGYYSVFGDINRLSPEFDV